ncbi:PTS glucose transporter subunit IIA [Companilactobacillus zhachilii]|jgi:PTS system, glucose subfamily, IIA component|uniref:PTS sugar transporter subunit IIA n=1 Tax=Companilactobacillus zhachilii TaxID=2304606 RepID=UPI001922E751|nr:PTS glucose transporter subunit IIA [Companilactobacillus zhachilii]MBL3530713.1 PTS glucose transporter subunit IIA [Companilactobacillus zhachilii]
MFGFGKKKEKLEAVADGKLIPLTEVNDDVFSEKLMGDGFAVLPTDDNIYSPVKGTVSTVFPTGHALGITTDKGLEVLVHMGLDTVELNGAPFISKVKQGQEIDKGDLLSLMDVDSVKNSGRDSVVVVVYTNMNLVSDVPDVSEKKVNHGEEIGEIRYK